ncbi:MAG TPA: aminopeptidase N [Streptosporangiaceae bacterium]|nr:aminopeptidase N [Streptosporangiaceae bacterium]
MTSNLSRDEAAARAALIHVRAYQVELDLHGSDTSFESLVTVHFDCRGPGADTFIDLTALRVEHIALNGRSLPLDRHVGDRIALPDLASSNELTVRAHCAYSRTGEGLHRFTDPTDDGVYLYSNLETFYAHEVYACFDQPDLKASFEFTVRCPADAKVISTMAPDASAEPTGWPGIRQWHFPPTPPISTYFTVIAAGPFHVVTSEHDGIPLGLYCRQSLASYLDPAEIFEITSAGFDFFHSLFGVRYPFGKFDQLFVPEFNAGAMENAGAVTFLEDYIFRSRVTEGSREGRADTILHELAHMWFGDLVTMKWWDDLWLNESFATWASVLAVVGATRWTHAWTTFAQNLKAWAYRQDQLPSTHPIVADITDVRSVEVYFDGITYAKGAAVLRQLVAFVGSENFAAGLRTYFGRHAWGNATLTDLLDALEETSGRALADWSKAWLATAGVNTLRPRYQADADGVLTEFAVIQQAPAQHPTLRPHRIAIGLYERTPAGVARRRRVELDVTGERTDVPDLIGERLPDLILVNDDDLSFAKIRLDEHSLRTVISSIGDFADPMPVALCLAAAWDMCRDAEMATRQYVALVLKAAESVREVTVLSTMLGQAIAAARRYADLAWRPAGLGQIAGTLRRLTGTAEPGGDQQLVLAQAFISVASSAEDLELLAGLLAGSAAVPGLAVDTDLRWQILRRLVSRGAAGTQAIDAEREADRTDAGSRQAITCAAAIPDPAAKEAAWTRIISGELANADFRATLRGFMSPDQDELLDPYGPRFFDAVTGRWNDWGPDMGVFFVENAYPRSAVTQQAIDSAAEFMAHADLPAALRRLLSEGRDDVVRALRCRERDAQE